VLSFGFAYDDFWTIIDNFYLSRPDALVGLIDGTAASVGAADAGRPLMVAHHWVERQLFGWRSPGYHLISLLWHVACCVLLYLVVVTLYRKQKLAVFSGLLFAVHPIHAEVVAVVSFREDSMACALGMASWLLFLHARRMRSRWASGGLSAAAGVSLFLAMASKESAAVLPVAILAVAGWTRRVSLLREAKDGWPHYAALFGAVACGLAFRVALFGQLNPYEGPVYPHPGDLWDAGVGVRVATALQSLAFGFGQLVASGWGQAPEYCATSGELLSWWTLLAAAVVGAMAGVIILGRRRLVEASCGLVFLIIIFLPTSNLVWMPNVRGDRFWYWPSAGFCLLAASLWQRWVERAEGRKKRRSVWAAWGVAGLVLIGWTAMLELHLANYKNDSTLWLAAARKAPCNHRALVGAAEVWLRREKPRRALGHAKEALALRPGFPPALRVRAEAELALGMLEEARHNFRRCLELGYWKPGQCMHGIARVAMEAGNGKRAAAQLERAARTDPGLWRARGDLAFLEAARCDVWAASRWLADTVGARLWPRRRAR
jgi:hypothetical protein